PAVHDRHAEVEEHEVGTLPVDLRQRLDAVGGQDDLVVRRQDAAQHASYPGVVVHAEHTLLNVRRFYRQPPVTRPARGCAGHCASTERRSQLFKGSTTSEAESNIAETRIHSPPVSTPAEGSHA